MPEATTKPRALFAEITGETEFHLGNSAAPLSVGIAIGYRRKQEEGKATENFLYATLYSVNPKGITIENLVKSCAKKDIAIPDVLKAVAFKKFSVTYGSGGLQSKNLRIEFATEITINDRPFDSVIIIDYRKDDKGEVSLSFRGILTVGKHRFTLQFTKEKASWYLYAAYMIEGKTTIDLREIATKIFGEEESDKMPKLSFTLEDFKAFLLYKKAQGKSNVLFGIGAGVNIDLKDLPMAGPILSKKDAFAFKEVLAMYAVGSFKKEELKLFGGLPLVEVVKGFNLSTAFKINGKDEYYVLNSGTDETFEEPQSPSDQTPAPTGVTPLGGAVSSKAKWKKLDKKIGPVSIQRLGFAYIDGKVVVLLDASMEMAGMGLQLMGFGLGFELKWPPGMPDFYLDGLGLSYKRPPLEISGAFLHGVQEYKGKSIDVYNGGAIIKVSRFTISAIGSYAKVEDQTSLFIYGVFDGPIGGPAFFFVTGIAAGFGYNRKVNAPSINEVALFPLVALAMRPQGDDGNILSMIAKLETPMKNGKLPIEISIGDYWLAVGIKFTSFKILETFVLVTVNFGTQLEFIILGLSRLSWPERSMTNNPIVYIELAIMAHFGSASDVVSIEAIVTPNSYVLSKDCKLTGGFAFYTWVKGPHEGDFVITLGGYHPKFNKPAHYPTVPRLGLNWRISKHLMIKGELYYALTSTAIMAGGRWEVLFKTSVVKVSIIVWADMLISWAPFQYYIDIGITLKIELNIKIAFIRIHLSITFGAQLHIWGPPFAGKVRVDLAIFSFTIPFGDHSKKEPAKLKWSEFSKGFIPQGKTAPTAGRAAAPTSNPDPINISITNGLIGMKGSEKDKIPVINPHQLTVSVDSFIPVSTLTFNTKKLEGDPDMTTGSGVLKYSKRELKIGVRPCGFAKKDVTFKMNANLILKGDKMPMVITCQGKGFPEALWAPDESKNSNKNPGTSKIIPNVLSGLIIQPPPRPEVPQIKPFDFSKLLDHSEVSFKWEFVSVQFGEKYSSLDVFGHYDSNHEIMIVGLLEKSFDETKARREKIHSLLLEGFDDTLPEIEETEILEIMVEGSTYFKGTPILCGIGEMPQYPTDVK